MFVFCTAKNGEYTLLHQTCWRDRPVGYGLWWRALRHQGLHFQMFSRITTNLFFKLNFEKFIRKSLNSFFPIDFIGSSTWNGKKQNNKVPTTRSPTFEFFLSCIVKWFRNKISVVKNWFRKSINKQCKIKREEFWVNAPRNASLSLCLNNLRAV